MTVATVANQSSARRLKMKHRAGFRHQDGQYLQSTHLVDCSVQAPLAFYANYARECSSHISDAS